MKSIQLKMVKTGILLLFIFIFQQTISAQYMHATFTDLLSVKAGGNLNNTTLSSTSKEAAGTGFGFAASLNYDYKLGFLLLSFGAGVISAQPKISQDTIPKTSTTEFTMITNSIHADGLLKFSASTGAYIGAGASAYLPFESPNKKNLADFFLNAEIGINLQISDLLFFTPALRVGYNLTGNNFKDLDYSKMSELNVQILVGVGFRVFNDTGYY